MTSPQHLSTDTNTDTCPRQEHDQYRTVSTDTNRIRSLRSVHVHEHGHGHMPTDTNTETFHEHDHGHGYRDRHGSTNRDADFDTDTFPRMRTDFVTNM